MIELNRPCPHGSPDAARECPRCGGDGFYMETVADPFRAPGTDADPTTAPVRGELATLQAGWLTVLFVAFVGFLLVLAAVWWFSATPRSSPDPTADPSAGDVSRPELGASGPSSSGAPRETAAGHISVAGGAPVPAQGQVGGSIAVGKASWCAPKGRYCRGWGGHSILAASPNWDGQPYWARVCRRDRPKVCATVYVHSICACGTGKVIDLTVYVFRDLLGGRLYADGVIDVTVRGVRAPALPATDTAPTEEERQHE